MKDVFEQLCCFAFPRCGCPRAGKVQIQAQVQSHQMEKLNFEPKTISSRIYCFVNLRQSKGLFFLGSIGALFVAISSAIIVYNPLEMIIKSQLSLQDGSFTTETWKKPPIKIGVKIFIFNVTNSEAFLRGEEKLRVEEVGPYVFTEELENTNVVFNANNTVTYIPKRTVTENKLLNTRDMKTDVVVVPNVIFLAVVSYLADHSLITNMVFNAITAIFQSQPFVTVTVEEYLLTYNVTMLELAHRILPEIINFKTFGILERMFDEGVNQLTMNLNNDAYVNADGDTVRPLSIDTFNGQAGLEQWGYDPLDNSTHNKCNTLQGLATEGVLFPRGIAKTDKFLLYRKAFCRTLEIVFDHEEISAAGFREYHYSFPKHAFDAQHPESRCYCLNPGNCLPNGLSDASPCLFNMPLAASFPHFYNGDPSLLEYVDGLHPNKEDHASVAVIQPDLGIVTKGHSRMQSNLIMKNVKYNTKVAPLKNMVLPLFWVDLFLDELPANMTTVLKMLVLVAPLIQKAVTFTFLTAGIILLAIATFNLIAGSLGCRSFEREQKSSHGLYKGYQSVHIIPVVRRESLAAA